MERNELLRRLLQINAWWNDLPVPSTIKKAETKRKLFYDMSKLIYKDRIVGLTGPRQVGKTTMMGQLIDHQLKVDGIPKNRIIYIPMDNTLLKQFSQPEGILHACLDVYSKSILSEDFSTLDKPIFIYLDEIQDLDDWGKGIKTYVDMYGGKMQFIVTGSSHTLMQKGMYESLVGRIITRILLPLKFIEYLEFMGEWGEEKVKIFGRKTTWPGREALKKSLVLGDSSLFEAYVNTACAREMGERTFFKKSLNLYLLKGGYPHSIRAETLLEAGQILRQDLELTVYKDIHSLFNTREPKKLMEMLTLIARNTGGLTSQNGLAKDTSFDWKSVVASIGYFEQLFMVKEVNPVESLFERTTKSSMLYFTDPGIFNVLLGQMDEQAIREDKRRLLLTALASHLTRLKMNLTGFHDSSLFFFEGVDSVEFIINKPEIFPVAVCLDGEDRQRKLEAMKGFMGTYESKLGILLTDDSWGREGDIVLMPAWLLLLLC
jgi:hypothetical protein